MKNCQKIFLFFCFCFTFSLADEEVLDDFTCTYEGKTYKLGEHIKTPSHVCFHCTCNSHFVRPDHSSCAIIDCPWGYYTSKPHCALEYLEGECCPELRCSVPNPHLDQGYRSGKRVDISTDGYKIIADEKSELTLYCVGNESNSELSSGDATWSLQKDGKTEIVSNGSHVEIGFFPPATWGLYFKKINASDDGLYICEIATNPPQRQTTELKIRNENRPPVIDEICSRPAFRDSPNAECPATKNEDSLPWFYNKTEGSCQQHTQMSCSWAAENHFDSMSECWNHCLDDCFASLDSGSCTESIVRFYYESSTDTCSEFVYGGCGGNLNNFESKEGCENSCANIIYRKNLNSA